MLKNLYSNLDNVTTFDRVKLLKLFRQIKNGLRDGRSQEHNIKIFNNIVTQSRDKIQLRSTLLPKIVYPELPIYQRVDDIKVALNTNQVIIVAGETGSGKSTQLPKICLELGRGLKGKIGHTQPRRLAVRSVADRLAKETNTSLGKQIGYKVRFGDKSSKESLIKVMTDGVLLAETQNDRLLLNYDTIIIDEAHERSLNIDFLLGYLKNILSKRPDLKVIITSATIDHERFSVHFKGAPIIEVSGRSYPVDIIYNDYTELYADGFSQPEIIHDAINLISEKGIEKNGDILVFFATEREIHEASAYLKKLNIKNTEVISLYARLSNSDQQKIFSNIANRKIILSTNVAETSLTVPGIYYVIDTGMVRISRYSYRTKVQRLPIEIISKASANQRSGRCGRIGHGLCIRLYSEEDYNLREDYTDPEIHRTNLASVILKMESLGLGGIEHFPFLDKPDKRLIKDGYRLLYELKAIDDKKKILNRGMQLSYFPIDPKLASMLLASQDLKCIREVLIIVSFLSIQDPREVPVNFQQKARQSHQQDIDDNSDFISIYNLWERFHSETGNLSSNQIKRYCQRNFISVIKIKEWKDIYRQLKEIIISLKWSINTPTDNIKLIYENIHKSIATGLLSQVGFNNDMKEYLGARGTKFHVFPGSSQFKKTPKWLICAELVETSKLYARTVAKISPDWLESISGHLTKNHYSEPYWSKKNANVMAMMRISLYGLDIISKRKVIYANINMEVAREIFIRHALVYGEFNSNADFYQYNLSLLMELEEFEHKSRKKDVVIDDSVLYLYYDNLIPDNVYSGATLNKWLGTLSKDKYENLFFQKKDLMKHDASTVTEEQYPSHIKFGEYCLPLSYHFEPGSASDGVTLEIPLPLLSQVEEEVTAWLVPGMLQDKITALLRSLPKNIRKTCVPIPAYVNKIVQSLPSSQQSLENFLIGEITNTAGLAIDPSIFDDIDLPTFYKMNYKVIKDNEVIIEGRNLQKIRDSLQDNVSEVAPTKVNYGISKLIDWSFGDLKEYIVENQYGIDVKLYPALVDKKTHVDLVALDSKKLAYEKSLYGVIRFLIINTSAIRKAILAIINDKSLLLLLASFKEKDKWQDDFLIAIYYNTYFHSLETFPRSRENFYNLLESKSSSLLFESQKLKEQIILIMEEALMVKKLLKRKSIPFDLVELYQSVRVEFDEIFSPDFIKSTSFEFLFRIDKYVKALKNRLEKAPRQLSVDRVYNYEIETLKGALHKKYTKVAINSHHELNRVSWLIKELWISWYAQEYKTIEPVSIKRISKRISELC